MAKSVIADKSFIFSIEIISCYKSLVNDKKEFVMSKQLLRSGTAVGALVREAQNAESPKDFIHKLSIAQKECDESVYWIDLLAATEYLSNQNAEKLSQNASELLRMIKSAILTVKSKLKK